MSDELEEDDAIRLPFVLTKRHGGEYETDAFNAGWHLGVLEARLTLAGTASLVVPPIVLKTSWRKQCDLMAMSHNLMLQVEVVEEDPEYAIYTFAPAEFFRDTGQS